ncbi:hypothetical protein ABZ318_39605, partial [Streptomyces sp. NPDC006197]
MSDQDEAGAGADAPDSGPARDDRGDGGGRGDRADAHDRGGDRGERGGRGGRGDRGDRGDRGGRGDRDGERGDGAGEQPREVNVFAAADRGPLAGGDTGGAATARRALRTWASGAGDRHTSIQGDGTFFEGNQFFSVYGSGDSSRFVRGPVPPETLAHLAQVYCEITGYQRMKERLRDSRVLVLCGEPGSGRKATALALLDEVTGGKVFRLDPRHGVDEITDEALQEGGGHLMELLTEDVRTESESRARSGRGDAGRGQGRGGPGGPVVQGGRREAAEADDPGDGR